MGTFLDRKAATAALGSALWTLRGQGSSPEHPEASVLAPGMECHVAAWPEGPEGFWSVLLTVRPVGDLVQTLAGTTVALRAAGPLRHLARLTEEGQARFQNVSASTWYFEVVPALDVPDAVALPALSERPGTISAAGDRYAVLTPDGIRFLADPVGPGVYALEVSSPVSGEPRLVAVPVRFLTGDGDLTTLHVPLDATSRDRASSRILLSQIADGEPLAAGRVLQARDLAAAPPDVVWDSVQAAGDRATVRAWRRIADQLPVGAAELVIDALDSLRVRQTTPRSPTALPPHPEEAPSVPRQDREPESGRVLTASLPPRASVNQEVSLIVRVVVNRPRIAEEFRGQADLKPFAVPVHGHEILVTVEAPEGLVPLDRLDQWVLVPAHEDSEPIRFGFRVRRPGLHRIRVTAWAGSAFLGELLTEVSGEPSAPQVPDRTHAARMAATRGRPGEVTLEVTRQPDGRYRFHLHAEGERYAPESVSLGGNPQETVEGVRRALHALAQADRTRPEATTAQQDLERAGIELWVRMLPDTIREQFWEQRAGLTAFTIATDHEIVPWELMYPLAPGRDDGFLAQSVPIARRIFRLDSAERIFIGDGAFILPPPGSSLAHQAALEIVAVNRVLRSVLRSDGRPHTELNRVLRLIESGEAGLLHFACHNSSHNIDGSSIPLHGGDLTTQRLSRAMAATKLATKRPLVFINACRSAGSTYRYLRPAGWAHDFIQAGAGAFMGTLWNVPGDLARIYAEAFYDSFARAGLPLGRASLAAREATRRDGDPTWLAYTLFGDPAATASLVPQAETEL